VNKITIYDDGWLIQVNHLFYTGKGEYTQQFLESASVEQLEEKGFVFQYGVNAY